MLTFEDCLKCCRLTEAEIDAIAEHENMPEMVALELANYLEQTPDGQQRIKRMILDDIESAVMQGNTQHALVLKATLKHFIDTHSETLANQGVAEPQPLALRHARA